MRFLVVSANQARLPDPIPPLGAAYAAAVAREAGHDVDLFDGGFCGADLHDALRARIASFRPDAIGLSLRNVDDTSWPRATSYLPAHRAAAATIREAAPGVPLVLGGSAFTLFPGEFIEELGADHGVVGEAETSLPALLDDLAHRRARPGELRHGAQADLSRVPVPARDLLDVPGYWREGGSVNLQTKRGCAFACAYCTYPSLEGVRPRRRPPAAVVDEMEQVLERWGVDSFFFVDSIFNVPADHAIAICEEIARRALPVTWTAYLTPATVSPALVDAMARAGCRSADLGTDAASEATMRGLGKGFDVADVQNASRLLAAAGIPFCHSLIFGGPGETWDTFDETVSNIVATAPTAVVAIAGVRLYPGTALAAHAVARGRAVSSIGIQPVFWIEEAVRDGLAERLAAVAERTRGWVVPGITPDVPEPIRKRLRAKGAKGPLWEQLGRS